MQNEVIEYVKQYAMITLSISIMSVGVYFFKFPNNFVFGGVTGMAALAAKLTPLSASAFSSAANMILLGVGLIFLGKKFAMTTGYATVVMSLELMALEKICPLRGPLSNQPMLDLLFAIALPAIASALLFNVGASSGGTDVIALIVEKYTHIHNVAVALFLTDLFMVIAACFVFDLYTALYSFVGLTVKSLVIDAVLEKIKMCKAILIVCDDRKPICDFVMRKLVRGATYTPCFPRTAAGRGQRHRAACGRPRRGGRTGYGKTFVRTARSAYLLTCNSAAKDGGIFYDDRIDSPRLQKGADGAVLYGLPPYFGAAPSAGYRHDRPLD